MSLPLVIYHAACPDGWCAAWIMHRCLGGAELMPARWGDPVPNVDGRTVYVVDFCYPRQDMIAMHASAHQMWVFDHHKSSEKECDDLHFCIFDQQKSGATLAYWWCHDKGLIAELKSKRETRDIASGMSPLSQYVQDRDLWQFSLDSSESINAAIRSYPFELEHWDYLAKRMAVTPMSLVTEGDAIMRYKDMLVQQSLGHAHSVVINGVAVKASLCTAGDILSEVSGTLAKDAPFGACYIPTNEGKLLVRLTSTKDGLDVSEIAEKFGGGGHARAAGFEVPYHLLVEISQDEGAIVASRLEKDG